MIGITAYGVCLPYYRIKRRTIFEAMGWFNPGLAGIASGEKTVANHDEDSLTLAASAGMDCCLSGALKAGTTALISALSDSDPGLKLVAASDCRLGKAGGSQEGLFGDAAVAFKGGNEDPIAVFEGHYSLSADFSDTRRVEGDQFVRPWEERWIRQEGYLKFIPQSIRGLLGKAGFEMKDIAKVVFPPLSARDHSALARSMRLEKDQVQDPLLGGVGNAGAAHPLLMLASALEEARPGDRVVVASYGSGSDALLFRVTEAAAAYGNRNKVQQNIAYKQEMDSYPKYLSFKEMLDKEVGIRGEEIAVTSLSLTWRERDAVLRLAGGKCLACGTPQFPRESMCVNPACGAVEQMEDYTFADKPAHLFTFTADHLAYSEDPPNLYGIVDFDGGGRYWFDLTDCRLDQLTIGQPVQMSFRRKYQDKARSLYGYFWKAMPLKD
ncbi:MAG: OB-fold domain-containing protein [Deltaproteobacteria bacterium]